MVSPRLLRRSLFVLYVIATLAFGWPAAAQDWFRTGTGLGVEKPRVAVADFAPRADAAKSHASLFAQVVRDDLAFSGILDVVSPSFYPTSQPSVPSELRYVAWSDSPINAHFVAFGNLVESSSEVAIQAWFYDVTNPSTQAVIAKIYRGTPTDAQVRKFAHQFADEIIMRLSGGLPGISSTQIAFASSRTGVKELWAMDYDGSNQHPLTSLRSISLTPRWSPDSSRIAFTCYAKGSTGPASPQICLYSMDAARVISFPHFKGTNSAPSWSQDGSKIVFSSSMNGNPELYSVSSSGGDLKRLTFANGASTSPAWNPKTGAIAFVSDRSGVPKLYLMDSDGTGGQNLDLPDKGYLIDPSWAPNGQLLAFSWRRPSGNYDIYIMDVATRQIIELTRDAGRNERPSWAPDGRHLVFESTRAGTRQIWTMLADGSQARQLTTSGHNESPNWSQR
jgi:TolB protein